MSGELRVYLDLPWKRKMIVCLVVPEAWHVLIDVKMSHSLRELVVEGCMDG